MDADRKIDIYRKRAPTAKIDIPAETTYKGLQIETLTLTVSLKVRLHHPPKVTCL